MKPFPISAAMLVVSLLLAPALLAQSLDSANQKGASPPASVAEVPRLIKFGGTLLDAQERPMAGPVGVTFALYSRQTGGAALWVETQNVKPDAGGAYTVLLGAASANGVPAELFTSGEARWLGIQVGQQPEHERILLVSVPYALKAGDAETLGGLPASAFVTTGTPGSAGNSGGAAGASSSTALPKSSAATTPKKAASTPQPATPCTSLTSDGTATANSIALFTTPCNVQSSLMTQASINGFPGVNVAGNNAGLLLNGTGTHQITVTGASSGRLGQDATGFFFSSDTNGKVIKFLTNNGTLNEWMRITSAGNVGIGTTTPTAKLDVNGNLNLPTTTGAAGIISLGGVPFIHNFGINGAGNNNAFFGNSGNFSMSGSANTAVGFAALVSNTTGFDNTAEGVNALFFNTTGNNNTAVGGSALGSNTATSNNTAVGANALARASNNSVVGSNTAVGASALAGNTLGFQNTAVGFQAGLGETSGVQNTYIGFNAGPAATALVNATAIGANALVSASNAIVLGGMGAHAVNVGIGTQSPGFPLDVAGASHFSDVVRDDIAIRSGSESGTTDPPGVFAAPGYQGLVVRRINSVTSTAGSVVARTDTMALERDGTNGGIQIAIVASGGPFTIVCLGVDVNTTLVGKFTEFTTTGTAAVYTDGQAVVWFNCSFGDPSHLGHLTQATLHRISGTATWVGTVTSTYNQ